ncbi:hypothetical protein SAMN05216228_102782 [Rhizobium tibeticum]|uniref:Uncharacterized protein n=1 Tax=Rhizobium tibeticum TaxID=501024 RepID=A0A1H8T836_9HYPH|nr:hypothetical protein [Rhizobium tibeticum]SEI14078.1 hypothetical protein RTCCBAU85039_5026 [Rhizobium tibeticum]SEO86688.1 hypothetical protein SAMN05216228_102782 [Rhizobium tibeticum]
MLDRTSRSAKPSFETAFRKWWIAQGPNFENRVDISVAKKIFRAGFASGRRADTDRYIFAVGRFRITVWADGLLEAKRKAMAEADMRVAKRGWKRPKGGWVLKEVL